MKKLSYLFAGLLLTACVAEYTVAPELPQAWDQEEFVTLPATVEVASVEAIDLAEVNADTVVVGTLTPLAVEEGEVKYSIVLEDEYKFPVNEYLSVPVDSLQKVVVAKFGKRPVARTLSAVINADVMIGGQASLVVSEAFDVVVTPVAPFIDKAYYLVGDMCAWDKAGALKFNHSGKDVYEDSEFSIIFKVPDTDGNGADYWKIIPAGNYDGDFWAGGATGVVGVAKDGDDSKEGTLVTENPGAGKINFNTDEKSMNLYKLTINMMDYTYKVEELNFVEYIYVPGNHQGWSPETAPALHGPYFNGVWTGYSMLDGGFKFTHERKWAGEYKGSDFGTKSKGLSGDNDIIAETKAFYYIKADVAGSKLDATEIKSYGVIGDAAPHGWDSDVDMTWDAEKLAFVIKDLTLKDGTIKFRANDDWGINVGGSFDDLRDGADNIAVTAGTYDIELYLVRTKDSGEKMTAKVTKK